MIFRIDSFFDNIMLASYHSNILFTNNNKGTLN